MVSRSVAILVQILTPEPLVLLKNAVLISIEVVEHLLNLFPVVVMRTSIQECTNVTYHFLCFPHYVGVLAWEYHVKINNIAGTKSAHIDYGDSIWCKSY